MATCFCEYVTQSVVAALAAWVSLHGRFFDKVSHGVSFTERKHTLEVGTSDGLKCDTDVMVLL